MRPEGERKTLRWSVGIEAEGERVLTREEVVELADAVAACAGIATGIGTNRYGARLVVDAAGRDEAIERATIQFVQAAARAGLPSAPIVRVEAVSEEEDAG
jgi:hypothetical protein